MKIWLSVHSNIFNLSLELAEYVLNKCITQAIVQENHMDGKGKEGETQEERSQADRKDELVKYNFDFLEDHD